MKLTVSKLIHYPEFHGFKLISGSGGLSNTITSCGILDYEYDRALKNKYTKLSFLPNQMILTSLQYAKEDPGTLLDTLRLLIRRNCSCLVIKNVYSLPISPHILRFSDSENFPIILIKDSEQYFENIILNTYKKLNLLQDFDKFENIVHQIITLPKNAPQQKDLQNELNPCLQSDLLCLYFRKKTPLTEADYTEIENAATNAQMLTSYHTLVRYKNGLLYIHSSNNFKNAKANDLAISILNSFFTNYYDFYDIGVSSLHYKERKLNHSIEEAIYSSYFCIPNEHYRLYETLGVLSILLPYCHQPVMQQYSSNLLMPIRDYDAENHTALLETARIFINQSGSITTTAKVMLQHVNTIRYRLKQISHLINYNVLTPNGYEALSLAIKIDSCNEIEL